MTRPDLAVFLLVDDNEDDCRLLRRAFVRANLLNPVLALNSGQEAIDYLSGVGKYQDRSEFPLPALVLLDLKMPTMSGLEVLRWIRESDQFRGLRVVMLSGSNDMHDMEDAYKAGANSFLIKPTDFEKFVEICRAMDGYWVWCDQAGLTAGKYAGIQPKSKP